MKFKLANGGVVASMKQPLQNKNFDRIEWCLDNRQKFEPFSEYGNLDEDDERPIWEITLYNPSTHLIRKSWNPGNRPRLKVGPVIRGHVGMGYHSTCWVGPNGGTRDGATWSTIAHLDQLTPGSVNYYYVESRLSDIREGNITGRYTQTVSPFVSYWTNGDPVDDYIPNKYSIEYGCTLSLNSGGGKGISRASFKIISRQYQTIDWLIHN